MTGKTSRETGLIRPKVLSVAKLLPRCLQLERSEVGPPLARPGSALENGGMQKQITITSGLMQLRRTCNSTGGFPASRAACHAGRAAFAALLNSVLLLLELGTGFQAGSLIFRPCF